MEQDVNNCAKIIDPKIKQLQLIIIIGIAAIIVFQILCSYLVFYNLKKTVNYRYYQTVGVMEQIYNVRISNGKVVSAGALNPPEGTP